MLQCSERHLYRMIEDGRAPKPMKLGDLNRWPRAIVEKWIHAGCPRPKLGKTVSRRG
jgi:excisionase family DNA binding protein